MNISRPFILRPIATALIMLAVLVMGLVAYLLLPISALPEVDVPSIAVTASYPGASPEVMGAAVAQPLERQFAILPDVSEITSTNALGNSSIVVQFGLTRTADGAASDVQSAINAAQGFLPSDLPSPPTYKKVNPADQPVILLGLTSDVLPLTTVDEYADTHIAQRLSLISGVAQVLLIGEQKFSPIIRVNPASLAAKGIGLDTAASAIASATAYRPMGTLQGPRQAFQLGANGQLFASDQFADVIVAYRNGAPVRLRDVGTVTIGAEQPLIASWINDKRGIVLAVMRQPGSNIIELTERIKAVLPQLKAGIPQSIALNIMSDRSLSIRAAFRDVQLTLVFTVTLVILVIFLFLRQFWATIIPSVAVPLSIIATFALMYGFGYTLDNLSLMGLTLAVGLVVDDAIVMSENIVRHLEEGKTPLDAALLGAGEIGFTIISITISLIAVFIPILLMSGVVGRMFREFAMVVSIALVASAFVSLTLTPVMGALFLKDTSGERRGRLYAWSEHVYERILAGYEAGLRFTLRHRLTTMIFTLGLIGVTALLFLTLPTGFFPNEDTGLMFVFTVADESVSFDALAAWQQQVAATIRADPDVVNFASSVGPSGSSTVANTGRVFVTLKAKSQRKADVEQVMARLRPKLAAIPGIKCYLQSVQNLRIGGRLAQAEYQYTLQDLNADELNAWAPKLEAKMRTMPGLTDVASDLELHAPRVMLAIDRDRASRLGVNVNTLQQTLYYAFGQRWVGQLYAPLNSYHITFEVGPEYQDDPSALHRIYVSSSGGGVVALSEFAHFDTNAAPLSVNHTGQFPSVTLSFDLLPGASLGQAAQMIRAAQVELKKPPTIQARFMGVAGAFQGSLKTQPYLIAGALFAVYIVLGILYESFIHPVTILLSLPPASVGALLALKLGGFDMSVVAIIGLIMLIGIVKKNAIMMIDFALEAERGGDKSADQAIYEAAILRFRPITMTSVAAILGTLPIALGLGAGAELRQPLGVAVVGGLVVSQVLTLFTVPVTYIYMDRLGRWTAERLGRRGKGGAAGPSGK